MSYVVAILGATGLVGREIISTLERRNFPINRLVLLGSPRSAGQHIRFQNKEIQVQPVDPTSFHNVDIALFSAGSEPSRKYAPIATANGTVVIDNSSAWRRHPQVPLIVPEVNMARAKDRPLGIIANPNCSTIQLVVALKPLHDAANLEHVVISTYQSVSGKGKAAIDELWSCTHALSSGQPFEPNVFPNPIAMNLLSDWKAGEDNYSEEELKLVFETRRILEDDTISISPTTVRVPVPIGHAESVFARFEKPLSVQRACDVLRNAPGIELFEENYAPGAEPQPLQAAGTDPVYVGRIRKDLAIPNALNLWIVADNLRKGAALNAVQIAERLSL